MHGLGGGLKPPPKPMDGLGRGGSHAWALLDLGWGSLSHALKQKYSPPPPTK